MERGDLVRPKEETKRVKGMEVIRVLWGVHQVWVTLKRPINWFVLKEERTFGVLHSRVGLNQWRTTCSYFLSKPVSAGQ